MIINSTKEFKDVCKIILQAIDTSEPSIVSETLELTASESCLTLAVTNREYYVATKVEVATTEDFKATVNALLFLRLIAQLGADTLTLTVDGNALVVNADGTYKLPLIYKDEKLLELPKILLNNITTEMDISAATLNSILIYNSRELQSVKTARKPVHKMYYMDNNGAITFTTGACVNNFVLEKPIKVLLSGKVVRLFRLFNEGVVKFELSQDADETGMVLTKVRFTTDNVSVTAITPSDVQLIESVPVDAIRSMSNKTYDFSVVLDKDRLVKALSRLSLFKKDDASVALQLSFKQNGCTLTYCDNVERLGYQDEQPATLDYELFLNIDTLRNIVDGCVEEYITLAFGDRKAVVLTRQAIKNIIPELVVG